jgi:hypothetical protein
MEVPDGGGASADETDPEEEPAGGALEEEGFLYTETPSGEEKTITAAGTASISRNKMIKKTTFAFMRASYSNYMFINQIIHFSCVY